MRRRSQGANPSTTLRPAMTRGLLVTSLWLAACGPAASIGPEPNEPGTQPHELGAAQHRDAAKREATRLEQHKELYDPAATTSVKRCDPGLPNQYPATPICWVETINPTAVHLQEVEDHCRRAVEHRKSARDLRAVEAAACASVANEDRDMSPFAHRSDILGVNQLEEPADAPKKRRHLVGATVVFRAVPRLTADELQRIVNCHLARNAAIGHDIATVQMAHCPLTERGARATVRPLAEGFAVDIRSDDSLAARAIWRRAQALAVAE
jgi:hypothetical protein